MAAPPAVEQRRKVFSIRPYVGGLKMDQDTVTVDPHYCVVCSNWEFIDGEARKRPGLTKINTAVLGSATTSIPGSYRFRLADGTTRQVACTPTRIYQIAAGGGQTDITGTVFTAAATDLWTYCVANNEFVGANGVDRIIRWDGSVATVSSITAATAPTSAKYVESYADRIVCARTVEGGVSYPRRIRWSANAVNTTWNTSDAGFADLIDTQGWITGLKKIKEALAIYKDDSIAVATQTGIASTPLVINQKVSFHGAISGQTIADIGDKHIFLGRDNVYMFDMVEAVAIGDSIRTELFGTSDFDRLQYSHAYIKDDRREYWLWTTAAGDTVPKVGWCYNYRDNTWSRHTWPAGIISSSQYALDDSLTIDDLLGTIDEQSWTFDSSAILAWTPFVAVGGTVGFLYYMNPSVVSDDGTTITASLELPDIDFGRPGNMNTVSRVGVNTRNIGATNMTIGYSTDGGTTFTDQTITYTPGVARHSYPQAAMIVTGRQVRLRIKNSQAAAAAFNAIDIDYIERGRVF